MQEQWPLQSADGAGAMCALCLWVIQAMTAAPDCFVSRPGVWGMALTHV